MIKDEKTCSHHLTSMNFYSVKITMITDNEILIFFKEFTPADFKATI